MQCAVFEQYDPLRERWTEHFLGRSPRTYRRGREFLLKPKGERMNEIALFAGGSNEC